MGQSLLCGDEIPSFLGVFDLTVAPPLLYYSYIPTILLLFFGFILLKRFDTKKQFVFLPSLFLAIAIWIMNDLIQWIASYHILIKTAWMFAGFLEAFVFYLILLSAFELLYQKPSKIVITLGAITPLLILVYSLTPWNIAGYDYASCEGIQGILWYAVYGFQAAVLGIVAGIGLYQVHSDRQANDTAKQTRDLIGISGIFGAGFSIMVPSLISFLVDFHELAVVGTLGIIAMVVALGVLWTQGLLFDNHKIHPSTLSLYALLFIGGSLLFIRDDQILKTMIGVTMLPLFVIGQFVVSAARRDTKQRAELERLNAEQREFLSFATHQIRSPLTSLKWGAESILAEVTGSKSWETVSTTAKTLHSITNTALRTVNDFLDMSKIEQGGLQLTVESVDIDALTHHICTEYQENAAHKGLQLTCVVDPTATGITIQADPGKLTQVIGNLIDNAIKYTESGSVTVRVSANDHTITLSVTDTGFGISAEELPKLTKKFSRGAAGKEQKVSGSGIGLYLAVKIMELHNGKFVITSPGLGKGSTFAIELPRQTSE